MTPSGVSTCQPVTPARVTRAGAVALQEDERALLRDPQVGGVILFSRNYADVAQLQQLVADIRACKPDILIAVDQEGGRVQRLRHHRQDRQARRAAGGIAGLWIRRRRR